MLAHFVTSSITVFEAAILARWVYIWQNRNWKLEKDNRWKWKNFLHEFPSKSWYRSGIHSLGIIAL